MDALPYVYPIGIMVGLVVAGSSRALLKQDNAFVGAMTFALLWPIFLPLSLGVYLRSRFGE